MNYEYQKVQKTLKQLMKSKGQTYQSLSTALNVSPATIKRRLNGNDLTLNQLKELAEALSVSFYELIELSKKLKKEPHLFTLEQEKLLASGVKMILLFRLILSKETFSQIRLQLDLTEKELRRLSYKLEQVGLAQLLPGDRFILLVHFPFRWQPHGDLTKAYDQLLLKNIVHQIKQDRGKAGFNKKFEFALSPEAYQKFCKELEELYLKYQSLSEIHLDSKIEINNLVSGLLFLDQFSIWSPHPASLDSMKI